MRQLRSFAIFGLIAPFALPAPLRAQAESGAQIFTSIDNSFPGGSGIGGFGVSLGNGAIALRGSFGLGLSGLSSPSSSTSSSSSRKWIGDADIVIGNNFGGLSAIFGGAVEPYAFAGIGAHSGAASPSLESAVTTWSYGGGATVPLSGSLGISAEARQRNQLGSAYAAPSDFVSGTEYRVGISFRFGSGRSRGQYSARSGAASPPRPTGGNTRGGSRTTWPASTTSSSAAARRVVPDAEQYIGVPYVYGGDTPRGFDCSGFVQYVYAREGVELPRTSRQMAGSGMAVRPTPSAMAVGDLMLFTQGGRISHVAIYAGSGRFIHSSSSGHGVRYDDLNTQRGQWFADHLVAVRRVAGNGSSVMSAFASSKIPFDRFDPPDSAPPAGKH